MTRTEPNDSPLARMDRAHRERIAALGEALAEYRATSEHCWALRATLLARVLGVADEVVATLDGENGL